jgi:regulation of enolase protein 1 (concanavalin A-like superfamily)
MAADINLVGQGKNPHRKAGWVDRQTLDANSPYIDAVVHGDGLIAMQYRTVAGGTTYEVLRYIKEVVPIQLERNGDTFTLSVAPDGKTLQPVGSVSLTLADPVYVGLAVCSHEANVAETAIFSNVKLEKQGVTAMNQRVL